MHHTSMHAPYVHTSSCAMWQILVLEAYIVVCSVYFLAATLTDDDLASNYAHCAASCTSMLLAQVFAIPTVKHTPVIPVMHAHFLLYVHYVQMGCVVVMLGCVLV